MTCRGKCAALPQSSLKHWWDNYSTLWALKQLVILVFITRFWKSVTVIATFTASVVKRLTMSVFACRSFPAASSSSLLSTTSDLFSFLGWGSERRMSGWCVYTIWYCRFYFILVLHTCSFSFVDVTSSLRTGPFSRRCRSSFQTRQTTWRLVGQLIVSGYRHLCIPAFPWWSAGWCVVASFRKRAKMRMWWEPCSLPQELSQRNRSLFWLVRAIYNIAKL